MYVRVKICGVTTSDDARAAADAGADAVGLVFAPSPRRVGIERALEIVSVLPPFVQRVAVFRHPSPALVAAVVERLRPDLVQSEPLPEAVALPPGVRLLPVIHDTEPTLRSLRAGGGLRSTAPVLLEGAGRGGRGVRPSWARAAELARRFPLVLAGGLTAENVGEAIRRVRPAAVDVSSGVESRPGVKDPWRIERFIDATRRAASKLATETRAS